jgi:plastocyanin
VTADRKHQLAQRIARISEATRFILVASLLAACSALQANTPAIPQTGQSLPPAIGIDDQEIQSGSVTARIVVSDRPAWIVIYADQNGSPGQVLGHAAVQPGINRDVAVPINEVAASEQMYAGLNSDLGSPGEFELPGADQPVETDAGPVLRTFHLLAGSSANLGELPTSVTVTMSGDVFDPQVVTIAVGGQVQWVNDSSEEHTVTAEDHSFLSGSLPPGASYETEVDQPGRYPYYCEDFGGPGGRGMSGVIVVR